MRLLSDGSEPVGQLSPQDWMAAAETQTVIAALVADGAEVRFVGGCVRDSVLKRAIKDIDIATHDPPDRVMQLLTRAQIRVIPTGLAHGTVTAVIGPAHFEITTLREDVETFGRHARVSFTDDWTADAARRDFTMNAMFADPQGRVYDPFGGLADLAAGHVRFVGDPMIRIAEDVLRLLRFFRFFAHYGRPAMDGRALTACRKLAPRLKELSGERVAGELIRLLQAPDPAMVLLVMKSEGILSQVLPEALELSRLKMLTWLESRAMVRPGIRPDALRRLGAILVTDAAGIAVMGERLKLSAAQVARLAAIAVPKVEITLGMDDIAARRALRRVGADTFRDLVLVAWADHRSRSGLVDSHESALWQNLLDLADGWQPVELPVRGADCLELGIPPGPGIGRMLTRVEQWWEAGDYRADRAACLDYLRRVVREGDAEASPET
ncbi:CCA tRNA nucleotidyltransferase [Magnetospirillum sulfuroxidans]|uniref:CCA tRNA nucleotidyltransferase n=1 Tax=Magnetospirillum sulfuroxidans TaxID=611300 RepID=A0ABS5I9Z8_9PROT|nr:CCA tRNA nucleotidyltransferase [Magnetospirillum sulfuroxidans]MBR9971242.1 CCA tRNA nucleotidyltransferase [Magnetospirillum sulfuroxidans]